MQDFSYKTAKSFKLPFIKQCVNAEIKEAYNAVFFMYCAQQQETDTYSTGFCILFNGG
jgi:hypothetical protein